MAGSVNKVIVLGNLGANPELKYLPSGQPVCEMRVATTEVYRDRNEQQQERTEWHRIVVWGKTGENCGKFLTKGQKVYVEGRLQTRTWDDKEGKKQYMTEIVANQVVFLSGPRGGAGAEDGPPPRSDRERYDDGGGYSPGPPSRESGGGGGGGRGGGGGYGRGPAPTPPAGGDSDFSGEDDIPF